MLAHPNKHPLNWFPYEVIGSIELLEAYVKNIEDQVAEGVANFNMNAETEVIEPEHPEEPARFITHHRGLDGRLLHCRRPRLGLPELPKPPRQRHPLAQRAQL